MLPAVCSEWTSDDVRSPATRRPFEPTHAFATVEPMTRTSLFLAFLFLAGACGGSDTEPKSPSTTTAKAPDEKSEDNIQMSAGQPASRPAPKETKPADSQPAPAPAPK